MMHPEPNVLTLYELRRWIMQNQPYKITVTRLRDLWHDQRTRNDGMLLRAQMVKWCSVQFGANRPATCINRKDAEHHYGRGFLDAKKALYTYDPAAAWTHLGYNFHFADPNAAFHFKLRW